MIRKFALFNTVCEISERPCYRRRQVGAWDTRGQPTACLILFPGQPHLMERRDCSSLLVDGYWERDGLKRKDCRSVPTVEYLLYKIGNCQLVCTIPNEIREERNSIQDTWGCQSWLKNLQAQFAACCASTISHFSTQNPATRSVLNKVHTWPPS